jgi:hypothetical protein
MKESGKMTRNMDNMKENGRTTKSTGLECLHTLTADDIEESGSMARCRGLE